MAELDALANDDVPDVVVEVIDVAELQPVMLTVDDAGDELEDDPEDPVVRSLAPHTPLLTDAPTAFLR